MQSNNNWECEYTDCFHKQGQTGIAYAWICFCLRRKSATKHDVLKKKKKLAMLDKTK